MASLLAAAAFDRKRTVARLATVMEAGYASRANHGSTMNDTANQFKKAPKRKKEKARSVAVSPEMRQAYSDLIKAREEREEYAKHLPAEKGR
jgi:hypothetical protein